MKALAVLCLALAACAQFSARVKPASPAAPATWQTATPAATLAGSTGKPLPAATTILPTQPGLRSGVTPTQPFVSRLIPRGYNDPQRLRQGLALRLDSPEWARLGLPTSLTERAEAYVQNGQPLPDGDARVLESVLTQWDTLEALARIRLVPRDASVVVQAYFPDQAPATPEPPELPLLVAHLAETQGPDGSRPIFLPIQPAPIRPGVDPSSGDASMAVGLALAPSLPGLTQQAGLDRQSVIYQDAQGRVVVSATMQQVDDREIKQKTLREQLKELYGENNPYVRAGVFPRFLFPVKGIEASFYGIDRSLSGTQITLLRETFLVYDRPVFEPLKPALFGPRVSIVVFDRLKDAAGLNYSGTGIIVLDRRDLFGNKYQLAQVLAHEASHVLQGELRNGDVCAQLFQREVADQAIPGDFLSWDAERLLEGIRAKQVGAYHVSLWMLTKLGVRNTGWLYNVIRTGTANGESLLIGCDKE